MPDVRAVQDVLFAEGREVTGREIAETALLYGRPLRLRFRGKPVPQRRAVDACELLAIYGRLSGQRTPRFLRDGSPTEALKRVLGALTRHDDVTFDVWATIIQKVLEHRWWGDGPPSIGVVFGPKVVEQNLADPCRGRSLTAGERLERDKMQRTARRLAAIRAVTA